MDLLRYDPFRSLSSWEQELGRMMNSFWPVARPRYIPSVGFEATADGYTFNMSLPDDVDEDGVKASIHEGLLQITLPRREGQDKEIPIAKADDG